MAVTKNKKIRMTGIIFFIITSTGSDYRKCDRILGYAVSMLQKTKGFFCPVLRDKPDIVLVSLSLRSDRGGFSGAVEKLSGVNDERFTIDQVWKLTYTFPVQKKIT